MAKNKKKKFAMATQASPFTNVIYNIFFIIFAIMCVYPMLLIIGSSPYSTCKFIYIFLFSAILCLKN